MGKFIKVEPGKVIEYWVCDNKECKNKMACINPDWHENNGTPVCECGDDMHFHHVEVEMPTATEADFLKDITK